MSLTNFPNGVETFVHPKNSTTVTGNITATTNSNYIVTSTATVTLPAIATGQAMTFINGAEDGHAGITISPAAVDGILYNGDNTDNKDIINTLATAKKGDYVKLASLASGAYWTVTEINGTWAKEA